MFHEPTPEELLKRWKSKDNEENEVVLMDFIDFIENEDLTSSPYNLEDRDKEDEFYVTLRKLIDKYLLTDAKSQTKIKKAELNLLDKWARSCKNG